MEKITPHIQKAKGHYKSMQYDNCLTELGLAKHFFDSLPSFFNCQYLTTETAHEAHVIRDTYEHECLCYARLGDMKRFQSSYTSLRYYYNPETEEFLIRSEKELLLTGLNLLSLLIENRADVFNAELELLSEDERRSIYINPIMEIERFLADGIYTKVVAARNTVPTNDYEPFFLELINRLANTIAEKMCASCDDIPIQVAEDLISLRRHVKLSDDLAARVSSRFKSSGSPQVMDALNTVSTELVSHEGILRSCMQYACESNLIL
ncbi:proteasome regulatory non-ATP-ase subunit [Perkinsela sp. CCAP 1560/4]|nr:proteasome regulatory non-ATP-ase subunit [Perkinsela sp. CCAP 1560/4]|eukprot:KNH07360.1 proteasome regulatory non-ATP-ase subunit [Perkinsela sp. CCAP 1560/4]